MIELLLVDILDFRLAFVLVTRICQWIAEQIKEREDIILEGVIIARDSPEHLTVLLLCEKEYHSKLLEILQQPPGEFVGKYIACVPAEEPEVVKEVKDEGKKDDDEKEITYDPP